MARTVLTKDAAPGSNANVGKILTQQAWDAANGNAFVSTGQELLVAFNSHASTTYTATVISVADPYGRSGDITAFSMIAQAIAVFGPFKQVGWMQTNGQIYCDASNAAVKFAVVVLP